MTLFIGWLLIKLVRRAIISLITKPNVRYHGLILLMIPAMMTVVADEDNRTYNGVGVGGDENSKDNGDNICNNRRNNGDKNGSDGEGDGEKRTLIITLMTVGSETAIRIKPAIDSSLKTGG